MITARLTHPNMLAALAAAGHGSSVLLTDGHYPAKTAVGRHAQTVHLNLTSGTPTVPEVLTIVLDTIPVEQATLISPSADALPSVVQHEILQLLPDPIPIAYVGRHDFYALARTTDLALCVVTGDNRRFANVLLTIGVLNPR
ncbi:MULTISPECIES: RbsD/FucU domain-containing protein [unclassified Pseudarthrobacter]|uniref:RbsD/FucU domain-containing protein n=1 Tax=unclassified Pseudarthrobacter TaxID=2647000 RepID=UPI002556CA5B|nr:MULTISPECIES: RbsD/FucU domain-containing protein [unclassified Pseudarthrobacter]